MMKFKQLLFLLLAFNFASIQAQVEKSMPTEAQWQTYFHDKQSSIKKKLYYLALDGKIKAFKNDSLTSRHDLSALKVRGGKDSINGEIRIDTVYFVPFNPNNLTDFWYCKMIKSSPFDQVETNQLTALGLTFKPFIGGIQTNEIPFCWITISDLKAVLTKEEFDWIQLIYYYAKNDNALLFRDVDYGDTYWEVNHVKLLKNISHADSLLYQKISHSLNSSSFYFEDFWYKNDSMSSRAIIYDFKKDKYISYIDFQRKYKQKLVVSVATEWGGPFEERDSVIYIPSKLEKIISLTIDKANNKIKTFNFEINNLDQGGKILKFSMDADIIRKTETLPTLFWFFEDYYKSSH